MVKICISEKVPLNSSCHVKLVCICLASSNGALQQFLNKTKSYDDKDGDIFRPRHDRPQRWRQTLAI